MSLIMRQFLTESVGDFLQLANDITTDKGRPFLHQRWLDEVYEARLDPTAESSIVVLQQEAQNSNTRKALADAYAVSVGALATCADEDLYDVSQQVLLDMQTVVAGNIIDENHRSALFTELGKVADSLTAFSAKLQAEAAAAAAAEAGSE